jgi:hypothetical protein
LFLDKLQEVGLTARTSSETTGQLALAVIAERFRFTFKPFG